MLTPAERVAADPVFRTALETARSWGVSPSVFLGRELNTRYIRDGGGRIIASATESTWNRDDRELAMALAQYEADCCPNCGGYLPETTAAENEERYDANIRARCHRCTSLDILQHTDRVERAPHPGALLLGASLKNQGEQNDDSHVPPG